MLFPYPLFFPLQGKKGKDPNAPKRPLSAYMLWLNANRDKIRSDSPGMSVTDVSKKAGELWKGMSKEKKEVGIKGALEKLLFYQSKKWRLCTWSQSLQSMNPNFALVQYKFALIR